MQIEKLTLNENDMKEAVQAFLATKGITMPVARVHRQYSWKDFEVEFVMPDEKPTKPEPVEEVTHAPAVETVTPAPKETSCN